MLTYDVKIGVKAFAITAVIFIIVYFSKLACFDTNDDLAVISILKGYFGWQPNLSPFLTPILSMMFVRLYAFNSIVPWFGLLQYLVLFIGTYWGLKMLLSVSWSWSIKVILMMVFISLLSYVLFRPNFGATSLFAGFMAAIYVLYLNLKGKGFWLSYFMIGIMFSLAYMFKIFNIVIILPIVLPVFLTFLFSSNTRKNFFVMLIPIVIILIASVIIDSHALDDYNSVQFARSAFFSIDYGDMLDSVSNLNAAGWNRDDVSIAGMWFTHDQAIFGNERITNFLLNDVFNNLVPRVLSQIDLIDVFNSTIPFLFILMFGIVIILSLDVSPFDFKLGNSSFVKWSIILSFVTIIVGIIVLACYRFAPRVFVPLFLYLLMNILLIRSSIMTKSVLKNIEKGLLSSILFMIILLLVVQIGVYQRKVTLQMEYQNKANSTIMIVKNIVGEDAIFVSGAGVGSTFLYTDPFKETIGTNYNLLPPGWTVNSPTYYVFLEENHIPVSKIVVFSLDNKDAVYSFYCQGWNAVELFERHFNKHYGSDTNVIKFEVVKDFRRSGEAGYLYMRLVTVGDIK